jgi:hypothetical protein
VKLVVGLTHPSSAWEQVLAQEGVSRAYVDFGKSRLDQEYSVIVATAVPDPGHNEALKDYLARGGAVLGYTGDLGDLYELETRPEHLQFLIADNEGPDITLLDLDSDGIVPGDANMLQTSSGTKALYLGPFRGGFAAFLPFDFSRCLYDIRPATRQFYATRERLPFERVSRVSKGEAIHLVHRLLERLHALRGIAYVRVADFPRGEGSTCVVRVDTDGASRAEVDELRDLAGSHSLRLSWFLDVRSHEKWLHHFAEMDGDELGVHCYAHQTYGVYEQNLRNIRKAKDRMVSAGLAPEGFAAPYGIWNPTLAAAVDDIGFAYSSEFSYAYDAFPFFPATPDRQFSTLQVPVHPVCLGSLKRVGYEEPQMQKYMTAIVERKVSRGEPLFFYHHPGDRSVRALDFLFSVLQERSGRIMTMGEFARWWKKRLGVRFEAEDHAGTDITARSLETPPDDTVGIFLEITRPDGYRTRQPLDGSVSLRNVTWEEPPVLTVIPEDIRRIREFDLRTTIAQLYASLLRSVR